MTIHAVYMMTGTGRKEARCGAVGYGELRTTMNRSEVTCAACRKKIDRPTRKAGDRQVLAQFFPGPRGRPTHER